MAHALHVVDVGDAGKRSKAALARRHIEAFELVEVFPVFFPESHADGNVLTSGPVSAQLLAAEGVADDAGDDLGVYLLLLGALPVDDQGDLVGRGIGCGFQAEYSGNAGEDRFEALGGFFQDSGVFAPQGDDGNLLTGIPLLAFRSGEVAHAGFLRQGI